MRGVGRFSATEAAAIVGLEYPLLYGWAASACVVPEGNTIGRGNHRRYSFRDLVCLACAKQLRQDGAALERVRAVVGLVRAVEDARPSQDEAEPWAGLFVAVGAHVHLLRAAQVPAWALMPRPRSYLLDLGCIAAELRRVLYDPDASNPEVVSPNRKEEESSPPTEE
jgi:DNA-binding transcriptional MerR regulator